MNKGFIEYIKDLLEPFGPITTRAMFGGYGIYKAGVIVGIVAENELYLKADAKVAEYFKSLGSEPFTYMANGKRVAMSYWKVLPEIIDQEELLGDWVDRSYKVAISKSKNFEIGL